MGEIADLNQLDESLNVPFPASTKQVAGKVKGIQTDVMYVGFSDKILITISQRGRLAHWVRSPNTPVSRTQSPNNPPATCATRKQKPRYRRDAHNFKRNR